MEEAQSLSDRFTLWSQSGISRNLKGITLFLYHGHNNYFFRLARLMSAFEWESHRSRRHAVSNSSPVPTGYAASGYDRPGCCFGLRFGNIGWVWGEMVPAVCRRHLVYDQG
eukprot:1180868-Prorocentrum_minimum.AAC.2